MAPTRIAARLVLIGLPLYVVEELAQMPAYRPDSPSPALGVALCGVAAVGDVVILVALWAVAARLLHDAAWLSPPRLVRYVLVVLAGIVVNAVVEWVALRRLGLWAYQPWQPTLPPLGTGLLAVLQPMGVVPLALWLVHRWHVSAAGDRRPRGDTAS